jgi:hypothetical protein
LIMGAPMRTFRLVRAVGGNGCDHHLLLRAGRPSYPNADQGAEDAAGALTDSLMEALTAWWTRWVLPAQCRWAGHEPGRYELAVIADDVTVVGPGSLELEDKDVGMRSFDVWIADRRDGYGAVLATVADADAFRAAAEEETDGEVLGPPVRLRVLFLAEGSGDGDLRNV